MQRQGRGSWPLAYKTHIRTQAELLKQAGTNKQTTNKDGPLTLLLCNLGVPFRKVMDSWLQTADNQSTFKVYLTGARPASPHKPATPTAGGPLSPAAEKVGPNRLLWHL